MTFIFGLFSGYFLPFPLGALIEVKELQNFQNWWILLENLYQKLLSEVFEDKVFLNERNLRVTSTFAHNMVPISLLRIILSNLGSKDKCLTYLIKTLDE